MTSKTIEILFYYEQKPLVHDALNFLKIPEVFQHLTIMNANPYIIIIT